MAKRSFHAAFFANEPDVAALLSGDFRSRVARQHAIERVRGRRIEPAVLATLVQQNEGLPPSEARDRNLAAVRDGAALVVTGQQVGLFLGPLYTLYKAASAVRWARLLEEETGSPCVPLFWLQTEDHDYPEINHVHLPAPGGGSVTLSLPDELTGPGSERVSVAHRTLGTAVRDSLAELGNVLEGLPHADAVMAVLAAHYREGVSLGAAFAGVVAHLFRGAGLLVFDPRVPEVSSAASPILRRAIEDHEAIAEALLQRSTDLRRAGFEPQVYVRRESPLVFVHPHGPESPRFRMRRSEASWSLVGPEQQAVEPLALLAQTPMCCSTSALLRPVVQDALLPVAVYVGGAAELAYFAQLPPLYRCLGVQPCLPALRSSFRMVDTKSKRWLDELGLTTGDLELSLEQLLARSDLASDTTTRRALLGAFDTELDAFAAAAVELDRDLEVAVQKTREHVGFAVDRLLARYEKARMKKDELWQGRILRLQALFWPGGIPQERHYSAPYFLARHGVEELTQSVLAAVDPLAPQTKEINLA